jgi:hypothetical protein
MRMPPFRSWQWMKRKIGPAAEVALACTNCATTKIPSYGKTSYCRPIHLKQVRFLDLPLPTASRPPPIRLPNLEEFAGPTTGA